MINLNLAERIFCDLRNAGVTIETPEYRVDGTRVGDEPNLEQLSVFEHRGKFGNGGISPEDLNKKSFEEAYRAMIDKIIAKKHVKFYSMLVPRKACIDAKLEEFEKTVSRYIEDYLPSSDDTMKRWDCIVQTVS